MSDEKQSFEEFKPIIRRTLTNLQDLTSVSIDSVELKPEVRWKEDLGLNSLAMVALLCELQLEFPYLTESMVATWTTLSDSFKSLYEARS